MIRWHCSPISGKKKSIFNCCSDIFVRLSIIPYNIIRIFFPISNTFLCKPIAFIKPLGTAFQVSHHIISYPFASICRCFFSRQRSTIIKTVESDQILTKYTHCIIIHKWNGTLLFHDLVGPVTREYDIVVIAIDRNIKYTSCVERVVFGSSMRWRRLRTQFDTLAIPNGVRRGIRALYDTSRYHATALGDVH